MKVEEVSEEPKKEEDSPIGFDAINFSRSALGQLISELKLLTKMKDTDLIAIMYGEDEAII